MIKKVSGHFLIVEQCSPNKAFMLTFSRGLAAEVQPKDVYAQTVVPTAMRKEIREKSGIDINQIPGVMDVDVKGGPIPGRCGGVKPGHGRRAG